MTSSSRRIALLVVINVIALPFFAVAASIPLGWFGFSWSVQPYVFAIGGVVIAAAAIIMWRYSYVFGALLYLAIVICVIVTASSSAGRGSWSGFEADVFRDWRFLVGVGIVVITPALLTAGAIIALRRRHQD